MAKIQINGRKINIKQKTNLSDLLKKYKLDTKKIALELNGEIIPKQMYKKKFVKNEDIIEIVHFIGGG